MSQAHSSEGLGPAGSGVSDLQLDGVHGAALSSLTAMRVSNGAPSQAAIAAAAGGGAAGAAAADHGAAAGKSLPAINSSTMKIHGHGVGGPLQQSVTHVPLHHPQQQPSHFVQQPQQSLQQQQQQQAQSIQQSTLDKFEGLHITGAGSLRDKEGPMMLLGESSTASAAVHIPTLALNPQASMDSIWEENSEMLLGGPAAAAASAAMGGGAGGQLLPPLMSKASSSSVAGGGVQAMGQAAARRNSYLGQQVRRQCSNSVFASCDTHAERPSYSPWLGCCLSNLRGSSCNAKSVISVSRHQISIGLRRSKAVLCSISMS